MYQVGLQIDSIWVDGPNVLGSAGVRCPPRLALSSRCRELRRSTWQPEQARSQSPTLGFSESREREHPESLSSLPALKLLGFWGGPCGAGRGRDLFARSSLLKMRLCWPLAGLLSFFHLMRTLWLTPHGCAIFAFAEVGHFVVVDQSLHGFDYWPCERSSGIVAMTRYAINTAGDPRKPLAPPV